MKRGNTDCRCFKKRSGEATPEIYSQNYLPRCNDRQQELHDLCNARQEYLYTLSNNGFYSKLYFTINSLEHQ